MLDSRADRYIARQDGGLLRAVCRVWRARERGLLMERVRAIRLMKDAWRAWEDRIVQTRQREDLAISFSHRSKATVSAALQTWQRVLTTHRNADTFAAHYHHAQLNYRVMLTWRLELRARLRKVKQAKMAEKFFASRKVWQIWRHRTQEQRREKALRKFERRRLHALFEGTTLTHSIVWMI